MKMLKAIVCLAAFSCISHLSYAQSTIYVGKDTNSGKTEYIYAYNTEETEGSFLVKSKLYEQGYANVNISKVADSGKKGYCLIVESNMVSEDGKLMNIFGAALGCASWDEAEKKAVENLKKNNPKWNEKGGYKVVEKFEDK